MVQVYTKPPYTLALAYPSGHSPKSRSETPRLAAKGVNPHIGIPSTLLIITTTVHESSDLRKGGKDGNPGGAQEQLIE